MLFKIFFFLIVFCICEIQINGQSENYFCSTNPLKLILKGFRDVEDIEKFCQSKSNWECDDYGQKFIVSQGEFTKIEFQNISITHLPMNCLSLFPNLKELNASNSEIEKVGEFTNYYGSHLEILNLSRNKIKKIENSPFRNLGNLKYLDLSYNQIEVIESNFFNNIVKSIAKIDLSYNKLKQFDEQLLSDGYQIYNLGNNLTIQLDNNLIEKFLPTRKNCALNLENLGFKLTLDLSDNLFKSIESKCDITVLDISNNQLKDVKANATEVIVNNNKIKTMNFFTDPNIVSLKNNDLQSLDYVNFLSAFKNVQELDISNNLFGSLKIETFADMRNLKKLSLRGIGLTKILFGLFGQLRKLEYLDLSYNDLSTFDHQNFLALDNLKTLDLSGNKLRMLFNFENIKEILPKLQFIALEGNKWSCSYLSLIKKSFNKQQVQLIEAKKPVKNERNIFGIQCYFDEL
ncbi:hypothetical protein PVAND_000677 [Polypedilum vanderplanki]|uniref:Uncharacterized protein n=1 Tax=Polypedilum vanderplanki TaxID=319348 RepID=A0A9J6BKK6_POLVA|nr:hypothetical protein PVAND_000677 [Polypedilum vanderplanki]